MEPDIAVITPSLNQCRFLERTVSSVLAQDLACAEYCVIDGSSDDGTVELLKGYNGKIDWVSERDRGQTHAINKGIRRTSAEVIGWLNSDDVYYPEALSRVRDFFAKHPNADLVYGDAHHIDENDGIIETYSTEPWNYERLKDVCFLCQPAVFFKRRMVERHGFLDETLTYCMDYEYWLRIGRNGTRVHYLPEMLAGSRMHHENKTMRCRVEVHAEINDMMKAKLACVPDKWIFNYAHAVLDSRGIPRSWRWKYAVGVSWLSLISSLRWNRIITKRVWRTTARWVAGNTLRVLKEKTHA